MPKPWQRLSYSALSFSNEFQTLAAVNSFSFIIIVLYCCFIEIVQSFRLAIVVALQLSAAFSFAEVVSKRKLNVPTVASLHRIVEVGIAAVRFNESVLLVEYILHCQRQILLLA